MRVRRKIQIGEPFRITLEFNGPIRPKEGDVLAVVVRTEGLPDDLHVGEEVALGLFYAAATHIKSMMEGPPDELKATFLWFMEDVWNRAPTSMPLTDSGNTMAEA